MRRAGLALALLYAAAAAATGALVPGARPLFDGFAPPPPYRYVSPPPELAATNQPPVSARTSVPLGEGGSEAANASTADAQALVTLPAGAVAPHEEDAAVLVALVPRAPGALAPLPPALRPVSNAYQLELSYQPSGAAAEVGSRAMVALTGATLGDTLLFSADGAAWQVVEGARPFGHTHGMTGPAQGPGYYLVAASPAVTPPTTSGEDGGGVSPLLAAAVALALVGGGGWLWHRRRRAQARAAAARARARRRQAPGRKPGRRR